MTRLEALKLGFSLDESTVLRLRREFSGTLAKHCPEDPEAFGDGMELRYRLILVISADSVDVERDILSYNECADRINEKYGPDTAARYVGVGSGGLNP